MDNLDVAVREQISRIDLNLAPIDQILSERFKLISEETKLRSEDAKLRAEAEKLAAERRKFDRDRSTSVLAAGAVIATAFTALGGLLTKFLGG